MASSLRFLRLLSSLFISISLSDALILPIMKDAGTLQYIAHVDQGTPPVATKLVVDLGGPFLWTDCESRYASSSSYKPTRCRSIQCSTANANKCGTSTCGLLAKNSITGTIMNGELGEDVIGTIDRFLFSCAPAFLLQSLASGAQGMVGLGRSRISLPSQLTGVFGFSNKFSICLPSSTNSKGVIFFDTESMSKTLAQVSNSLMYTPLITTKDHEYYIGVKSIKINGRQLSLDTSLLLINEDGVGGTKLSTVVGYTTLESSIYNTFTRGFTDAATSLFNMTGVVSVAPFEVCFSSKGIANTRIGPTIDLVLQSNMVKWRIHGANSMVRVSDEVMCLGFLDGGLNARSSIVIGGYQLENNLLEFDLAGSRMGFTSLLEKQIECSSFNFHDESSRVS